MGIENLDRIFSPSSIAVIGAKELESEIGSVVFSSLEKSGFQGEVFVVHPTAKKCFGRCCVSSAQKIPQPVDLAIITAPAESIPEIVSQCARAGFGGGCLLSGIAPPNGGTQPLSRETLAAAVGESNFRILGPNSLGFLNPSAGVDAGLLGQTAIPGKIAFVSQSGGICTSILDLAAREQIGFRYFVNLGDMADVDFGDMIDFFGGAPQVNSIVMYVENLNRIRNFMSAARGVSRLKPIIILKSGRTDSGKQAIQQRGSPSAGDDAVYNAAFQRAGIVRVRTFEELFDCAEILAKRPRISRAGLAVITNAGGPGAMAADTLADYGLEPARLTDATLAKLDAVLPPCWNRGNPIDIQGNASPERFSRAADICLSAGEIDALLLLFAPNATVDATKTAVALATALKDARKPVFTVWMGGAAVENGRSIFNTAGIPTFVSPERAVRGFADIYQYTRNIEMLQEIPPKQPEMLSVNTSAAEKCIDDGLKKKGARLSGGEAAALLQTYGIPILSVEKSSPSNIELHLGCRIDPAFGPVLLFGLGGRLGAFMGDQSIALPPLNRLLARRMMEKTRVYHFLKNQPEDHPVDLIGLEEILIRLSQLVTHFSEIRQIDIHPIRISKGQITATAAEVRLAPTATRAPMHLVISSYPNQYETKATTRSGIDIFIRPIRPEDAHLLMELFENLSPRSIYLRFFSPLKQLSHRMLARFTQIDYDREIALVALPAAPAEEKMLGVARLIVERNQKAAEFAVLTGDPWQGKGIGAELLRRCLNIAKDRAIEHVWGLVLAENTNMLALGRKLAFSVRKVPGGSEYRLEKDLSFDEN